VIQALASGAAQHLGARPGAPGQPLRAVSRAVQPAAESAKAAGAIHHRFGIGDGYVVVVDEWESPSAFEAFMSDPELQQFIASAGAAAGPPDVTITEAVRSPDEF
jgi:quinol monooxygenase YgiN